MRQARQLSVSGMSCTWLASGCRPPASYVAPSCWNTRRNIWNGNTAGCCPAGLWPRGFGKSGILVDGVGLRMCHGAGGEISIRHHGSWACGLVCSSCVALLGRQTRSCRACSRGTGRLRAAPAHCLSVGRGETPGAGAHPSSTPITELPSDAFKRKPSEHLASASARRRSTS